MKRPLLPLTLATSFCFRYRMKEGKALIWFCAITSLVMGPSSTLKNLALSPSSYVALNSSKVGANFKQGPHQAAQKSTTTKRWPASTKAALNSLVLFRAGGILWEGRRRGKLPFLARPREQCSWRDLKAIHTPATSKTLLTCLQPKILRGRHTLRAQCIISGNVPPVGGYEWVELPDGLPHECPDVSGCGLHFKHHRR